MGHLHKKPPERRTLAAVNISHCVFFVRQAPEAPTGARSLHRTEGGEGSVEGLGSGGSTLERLAQKL